MARRSNEWSIQWNTCMARLSLEQRVDLSRLNRDGQSDIADIKHAMIQPVPARHIEIWTNVLYKFHCVL